MGRIEGVSAGFEVDDMDPSGGSNLKVLFVHISPGEVPSFVQRDIDILRSAFQVTIFFYSGWRDIPRLLKQVLRSDVIVSWFAWDQAFWGNLFAYIFRRGAITIVGGFDVASVPEISYGNLLNQRYASSIDVIADARMEPNPEIFHPGDGRSFYCGISWGW